VLNAKILFPVWYFLFIFCHRLSESLNTVLVAHKYSHLLNKNKYQFGLEMWHIFYILIKLT